MLHVANRATAKQAKHGVETYNSARTNTFRSTIPFVSFAALGLKPNWNTPAAKRADRRQPVHFSRHQENPRHRWKTTLTIEQSIIRTLQWLGKTSGSPTPMNITVLGLWHLGCVTAACGARISRWSDSTSTLRTSPN